MQQLQVDAKEDKNSVSQGTTETGILHCTLPLGGLPLARPLDI